MSDPGSPPLRQRGRKLWFQIHKWLGLALLLVLIPVSASGSLLVWHDWADAMLHPKRYAVSNTEAVLAVDDYTRSARAVLAPGDRIASIELPGERGEPVVVTAARLASAGAPPRPGPPARTQVWLDPVDARVADHADAQSGPIRFLHVFHGSLMVPGTGRTIVGWLGVAMLLSALTGLWLWLPQVGRIARGLRWRRGPLISGNLHHQVGVWIALPLAILSFTGAYISFPNFFRAVEQGFGASAPARPGGAGDRNAPPIVDPRLAPDVAIELARGELGNIPIVTVRWPSEKSPKWAITAEETGQRTQVTVDDRSGAIERPPLPASGAARLMRTLHDGSTYNVVWQMIIFIAGFAPAILGVTGVIMWLRTRVWRRRAPPMAARQG